MRVIPRGAGITSDRRRYRLSAKLTEGETKLTTNFIFLPLSCLSRLPTLTNPMQIPPLTKNLTDLRSVIFDFCIRYVICIG